VGRATGIFSIIQHVETVGNMQKGRMQCFEMIWQSMYDMRLSLKWQKVLLEKLINPEGNI